MRLQTEIWIKNFYISQSPTFITNYKQTLCPQIDTKKFIDDNKETDIITKSETTKILKVRKK